jgi:outer membrane immunogenic protein
MKSLRNLLLTTASSVAFVGTAAAADMPVKAAPVPVVWNWAGPYVGLNVGAAWNNAKFSDLLTPNGTFTFPVPGNDPFWSPHQAGFTFGGQAGYNWQTGNIVYGIEGDVNWVDSKASEVFVVRGQSASSKLDFMATGRGRLGVAFSQFLIYGTGGVAIAHFSDAWGPTPSPFNGSTFSSNQTRVGWTAGGGLEYMLTRNWTVRVEGLYSDFGTKDVTVPIFGGNYVSAFRHTVSTVRGALNWKW